MKEILPSLVLLVVIFILLFFVTGKIEVLSVMIYDDNGNELSRDEAVITKSVELVQSAVKGTNINIPIILQSTVPMEENATKMVLQAMAKNPFQEQARVSRVEIHKNGELIHERVIEGRDLQPGETYIYRSEEIELKGLEAQRNTVKITLTFQTLKGEKRESTFEYQYLTLINCISDGDCKFPHNKCDIENKARFATKPGEAYCVRPCGNNGQCYSGQICLAGVCGYQ